MTTDYKRILAEIAHEIQPYIGKGKVADYIPVLASVPADKFGLAIYTTAGGTYTIGDATESFSIQSISKAFMYVMAVQHLGDDFWNRVGKEPSGRPFNSLIQLEYEKGRPRNPFINAGALVTTDCVMDFHDNLLVDIIQFVRKLADNEKISYDAVVAASEKEWGSRNAALAHFLKSFGNIHNKVEAVLEMYFHQCSIAMSCVDLAKAFSFLSAGGKQKNFDHNILSSRQVKRMNAVMTTCGLYDGVGDFAYRVGMPGKSGVGGGILAVIPGVLTAAVWSPTLNETGNSVAGIKALELLTTKMGVSLF